MQKNRKTGLPNAVKMRHDNHYVELITARAYGPRIRMISVDKIAFLNQLILSCQEAVFTLEHLFNTGDSKKVEELKKTILDLDITIKKIITDLKR